MRALLIAVLLAPVVASAQGVIEGPRLARFLERFDRPDATPLACDVRPIPPTLNFAFRFQAGYVLRLSLGQFVGPGHRWYVLVRIAPQSAEARPVHLLSVVNLPDMQPTKAWAEIGGGYLLGEGHYAVEWTMWDDANRVCRKKWRIDARLARGERSAKLAIPPNTVHAMGVPGERHAAPVRDAPPMRLAVLLHAAPYNPRRTVLQARDGMLLLSTLSTLLEQLPARPVRLHVFSLDRQKVLFSSDAFLPAALGEVSQAISTLQLGTVSVGLLQNRAGDLALLADLMNRELRAASPPDAVIFLGPPALKDSRLPDAWLERGAAAKPRFFYFKLTANRADFPDCIDRAVAMLKGKTLRIHSPGDFAKAIGEVERR